MASTENYTLGKGVVYFDQLDSNGVHMGERDMGNAPSFSYSVDISTIEHESGRTGMGAVDAEAVQKIVPSFAFTLDELDETNMSISTLGTLVEVVQTAGSVSKSAVTAKSGMRVILPDRNIGVITLAHGTVTGGPFSVGETVTGAPSTATGKVTAIGATYVQVVSNGTSFASGDTITGGTSSASATLSSAPVFTDGVVLVQDSADTITYTAGTDYKIVQALKDHIIGRIEILEDGAIVDGSTLHVTYQKKAATYSEIKAFTNSSINGRLRFVSDNALGSDREIEAWRVSLTPDGDTALIGSDWSTLGFNGKVLDDSVNHPDNPFMAIRKLVPGTFTAA